MARNKATPAPAAETAAERNPAQDPATNPVPVPAVLESPVILSEATDAVTAPADQRSDGPAPLEASQGAPVVGVQLSDSVGAPAATDGSQPDGADAHLPERAAEQAADAQNDDKDGIAETQPAGNPNAPTIQIYPMRSYMDADELRRRGGPSYSVPRRHGEDLVQRKLASFQPLEE